MIVNKKSIEDIFKEIEKSDIEINNTTNWNFYFFDKEKRNINKLGKSFLNKKENYVTFIDEMDDDYWRLKVSIKKVFTPESLYKNNLSFNYLIEDYNIELFDGWDVDV